MRLASPGGPHLTYCTNVHPGEGWAEVFDNLERYVVPVKALVSPEQPFGVGLRLSARAAEELSRPGVLAAFRDWLGASGLYVFTLNGFPHGAFHGAPVKEGVYRPDWLEPERGVYTERLAHLLAALLPEGVEGSISTVPCAFRTRVRFNGDVERMARRLLEHLSSLHRLREDTGRRVSLALEPEPGCFLETTADVVSFFQEHLLSRDALACFGRMSGLSLGEAEAFLRYHLGVCLDACHLAVEFEQPRECLEALGRAGLRVCKYQLSAGLRVRWEEGSRESLLAALSRFAEGVYLHQVVQRRGGTLAKWDDLPEALARAAEELGPLGEWRIHFHVPIFHEALGHQLTSTQAQVSELLALLHEEGTAQHLEVETYTWEVLPEELRTGSVVDSLARELRWVRGRMEG